MPVCALAASAAGNLPIRSRRVCRYKSSLQDACNRAEALRIAAKNPRLVHHRVLLNPVTVSIRIAGFPDHGQTAQELLDAADKSLYQSKAHGRDRTTLANV